MLREVEGAVVERRLTLVGRRYRLVRGRAPVGRSWGRARQRALVVRSASIPVPVAADGHRAYWLFEGRLYWEDADLEERDVLALVRERERRQRRRLERAHATLAAAGDGLAPHRRAIPREVRQTVFERDGGRCADCGSAFDLQYDHVIPVALGGADNTANLQLLCGECNRRKGAGVG
jgi:HNH endonuclease